MKRRRRITLDRGTDPPPQDFVKQPMLVREQIGPKRHLTTEGFLLCEDVPIARTGWMLYGPGEVPIKTGDNGVALVFRDAETLFSQRTIASFAGKSVTNDHPTQGVTPENWSKVTVGTAHNLRRGAGEDSDVLFADLLITDADAIKAVQQGKREVSAGYDADYEQTGPGEGRQLNIIGNHIALVERGRCGPRCAIGDHAHPPLKGKAPMGTQAGTGKVRRQIVLTEAVRKRVLDAGMEAMGEALADPVLMGGNVDDDDDETGSGSGESHVHIHLNGAGGATAGNAEGGAPAAANEDGSVGTGAVTAAEGETGDPYEPRFKKLEDSMSQIMQHLKLGPKEGGEEAEESEEKPKGPPTGDDMGEESTEGADDPEPSDNQTQDSAALEKSFQQVKADAEILVPGFKMPTFDAKVKRKATVDTMCALRRRALDAVSATADGSTLLETMNGGKTFDSATCDCAKVAALFKSAAAAKRLVNNRAATGDAGRVPTNTTPAWRPVSIADIAKANATMYPRP